jgi:hypothetical protein
LLTQLAAELLQVLIDLVRVKPAQDSREDGLRSFVENVTELSIAIRVHIALSGGI